MNRFAQAVLSDSGVWAFGQYLRPLSCFHWIVLRALEHPILNGNALAKDSLYTLVYVLTLRFADRAIFSDPSAVAKKATEIQLDESAMEADTQRLMDHIEMCLDAPQAWGTDDGRGTTVADAFQIASACLAGAPSIPEDRAWDMSIALAKAYALAYAERQGAKVVSEAEQAAIDRAQETGTELLKG